MKATLRIHPSFIPTNEIFLPSGTARPAPTTASQPPADTARHRPQSRESTMRRLLLQKAKTGDPKALADRIALLRTHAYLPGTSLPRDYEVVTYASPDGQTFKVAGKRMPGDQSRFLVKNPAGETLCQLKRTPTDNGGFVWMHPQLTGLRGGSEDGYTLTDAMQATDFPDDPGNAETVEERLNLAETSLDQIFDPEDVDEIESGHLFHIRTMEDGAYEFDNYYSRRVWIMSTNYRNQRWCDFFMSDVIAMQASMAGCLGTDLGYLIRQTINSHTGSAFFNNHSFDHLDFMSADQLDEFMTTTVNGKSSQRILDEYGLQVVHAQVLFNEEDGSNEYSVVLKTELADS